MASEVSQEKASGPLHAQEVHFNSLQRKAEYYDQLGKVSSLVMGPIAQEPNISRMTLKEAREYIEQLRPGSLEDIFRSGSLEIPEKAVDELVELMRSRPRSLDIILEKPSKPSRSLKESPEEAVERLRKAWPLTIEDAGLEQLGKPGMAIKVGDLGAVQVLEPESRTSGSPLSTQEVIDKFLASKRPYIKPISLKSYELNLRTFARHYSILPTEPEPIEQYLGHYSIENTGINNIDSLLRLLYDFASKRLGLPNPMKKIKRVKGKAKPPQHLTMSQALALLDAIQGNREEGLVYCLLGLGLRLSEVRRLKVADIGEDTILVHGKERTEPMPLIPEIRNSLLKLAKGKHLCEPIFSGRAKSQEKTRYNERAIDDEKPTGVERNGQPLSDSMIQLIIKRLFQRAGITGVRPSPHTLRHSRGVISDIAGLDDYSSRRLLRHADTQMTDRYSALNLEELRAKEEQYNPLRVLARQNQQLGKRPYFAQSTAAVDTNLINLIDNVIALGEAAKELKRGLGGNGHWPEQLKEIAKLIGAPG